MNRPINPRPATVASPSAANPSRSGGRKMVVPFPAVAAAGASSQTVSPISTFIDLEIEARKCGTLEELRYVITNTTGRLAHFEQAFLIEQDPTGNWSVTLSSGVPAVDRHTRIVRTLDGWLRQPRGRETLAAGEMRLLNLEREVSEGTLKSGVFSAPYAVFLPIRGRDGRSLAALIALKSESWLPQQTALLSPLADAYGHAWAALQPSQPTPLQRAQSYITGSRVMLAGLGVILLAAFVQVPMSALAPAEVVATEPMLVTAPLDGVISEILAPPGA